MALWGGHNKKERTITLNLSCITSGDFKTKHIQSRFKN